MNRNEKFVLFGFLASGISMPTSWSLAYISEPSWIWLVVAILVATIVSSKFGRTPATPVGRSRLGDRSISTLVIGCWISITASVVGASRQFGIAESEPAFLIAGLLAVVALYQASNLHYSLDCDFVEEGGSGTDVDPRQP